LAGGELEALADPVFVFAGGLVEGFQQLAVFSD
jgi:hypothetical protein